MHNFKIYNQVQQLFRKCDINENVLFNLPLFLSCLDISTLKVFRGLEIKYSFTSK